MEIVATDTWAAERSAWWPGNPQRFRARRLLGTFTSSVELLDGPRAGEVWGIQSWRPYRRARPGAPATFIDADPAIEFYLPTLHYFDELPLRLLGAEIVADAGPAELDGRTFDRVFVTWGSALPHAEHDQYLLWIDPRTSLLALATYTVRDGASMSSAAMRPLVRAMGVGSIYFDDYRAIEGATLPFRQTVVIGPPKQAAVPSAWFHQLLVDSVELEAFEASSLQPDSGLPEPADRKP
jgi:hypothetical protein